MKPIEQQAIFAIAATLVLSMAYFLLLKMIRPSTTISGRRSLTILYMWRKLSGFFILGILPFILSFVIFDNYELYDEIDWNGPGSLWMWIQDYRQAYGRSRDRPCPSLAQNTLPMYEKEWAYSGKRFTVASERLPARGELGKTIERERWSGNATGLGRR